MAEAGKDEEECRKKMGIGLHVLLGFLDNVRGLQLECARVLHELLLVSVFMYGSDTLIRREKKRSMISAVQTDNLRGLLGFKRMDKVSNAWVSEEWTDGLMKALGWYGHSERRENDRIGKSVYCM